MVLRGNKKEVEWVGTWKGEREKDYERILCVSRTFCYNSIPLLAPPSKVNLFEEKNMKILV